jgi:uncharacterized protein
MTFEWDEKKDIQNQKKHGISFNEARNAFYDLNRIIVFDPTHSTHEKRYFCLGKRYGKIMTVRFTYRKDRIRIIGAGYWRKGAKQYEKENS